MRYRADGRADGSRRFVPEPADRNRYAAVPTYTPENLTRIFRAANSGDTEQLCLCAREILERNWDIIGALEQRSAPLLGAEFTVTPGGPGEADKLCAEGFDRELRSAGELSDLASFNDLLAHLCQACVYPFAAAEIVWGEGGGLAGFSPIEAHHFTLRNGFTPRLVCDAFPEGMPEEEARHRFIFHQFRRKSDPARAGLIRVLAWLHCFQNWPLKDLFSFIERFGMPFVVAKVDQNTWENERQVLHSLIRSFGPSGGGVFTKATELQLLNASNTGGDNVYFRALEFTHNAIYTLLVGQLASSGESSGWSKGDAQTAVRQDILEADARSMEATIRAAVAAPWTTFHFPGAKVPILRFKVEPAEDQSRLATVVSTLAQAGFKADLAELSARFGLKLRYEAPAAPAPGFESLSDQSDKSDLSDTLNLKQKYDAMGVAIRAGLLTATPEIEAQTRAELGLPAMSPEVRKAWEATGGIRQPITLKSAESEAVSDALDVDENAMTAEKKPEGAAPSDKSDTSDLSDALERWLGPLADGIADAAALSDEELDRRLRSGSIAAPGSSAALENAMTAEMRKAFQHESGPETQHNRR